MRNATRANTIFRTGLVALLFAALSIGAGAVPAAQAAAGDVVINELHYHAPDGDLDYAAVEFIELRNTGPDPVDVGGWSFTAGITIAPPDVSLPAGLSIPPGGYLLGTNDPALFTAKYGVVADFSYAGTSLSNGGETVTLADASSTVIDTVTYDDVAPWPASPDGLGPSLEYNADGTDNALAANWHPSEVPWGTPGAANSIPPLPLTVVAPTGYPAAGVNQQVTATAPAGATIDLTYKIMYGADVSIPMLDNASSPGGADDGVYAATIPGAGQGQLVRFKVAATKGAQSAAYPPVGDSRPYDGYVHHDSDFDTAQFPVLQWFMPEPVYQDMITNHRCDDVDANATFVWNGKVLDGGAMHIKGDSSCPDPKAKWDVELPAGHTFDFGAPFDYPLKGFDLQNENIPRPRLGWEMIADTGEASAKYQTMRIQRNGAFFGVFGVIENLDSVWRTNHGLKDAPLYKIQNGGLRTYPTLGEFAASGDVEKKNPDDGDYGDIYELTQKLALPNGPAKWSWMQDNLDLPQIANYTAVTVAMRHWDSGSKNYYFARSPITGRWQIYSWDLDGILNNASDPKGDFVFPSVDSGQVWKNLAALPGFTQMHYRRARTIFDQLVAGPQLLARFDQLTQPFAADIQLDFDVWGSRRLSSSRTTTANGIQERRNQFAANTPALIPVSQAPGMSLVITEIQYHPSGSTPEFIEVYNPAATAVDVSGWTISALGTGYTLAPGTVVAANSYAVWTADDLALKAAFGGTPFLMAGQYPGALDNAGEEVAILDGSRVVDTVTYAPTAPWPTAADGSGPSLELTSLTADNADPANWAASTVAGGTPGARNSTDSSTGPVASTVLPFGSTWRYLASGSAPSASWKGVGFNDSSWPSGAGALGFRTIQATAIPPTNGRITYYFRTEATIAAGPALLDATLDLKVDDGAVVYVNGVEAIRRNLPAGVITSTTKAVTNVGVSAVGTVSTYAIPPSALRIGSNVISVEVHQYTAGSSADLLWDGQLRITR